MGALRLGMQAVYKVCATREAECWADGAGADRTRAAIHSTWQATAQDLPVCGEDTAKLAVPARHVGAAGHGGVGLSQLHTAWSD